ncbi:putative invertase inhibitor [Zingiber officinale]|uniref:Pectinesterase inhibitor domain-containing protein n=1 Tax=Zingiber officinale TaxID=94328 RepID=A0A8J5C4W4_ZINOF|nr:putative invertase inhibitor [Zingiber officinale]XP_042449019.1 putative invertase inhibitor [Zingiber officinale]KAG6468591.1 hypothetical protein ZIOFF_073279 [Zingiber officinale]KAG6468592.1 hypothetical protein ZIOFF_073280 [Zingiber officinale]
MMMRQAPAFALAALLLLLLSAAAHATVESTCKSISNVKYDFCVKTLKSDPSSGTADVRGLAVIATNLSLKKATKIAGKIKDLLKRSQDKAQKESLSTCAELYSNLIDNLDTSLSAIKESRKGDAMTYLSASLDAPGDCEQGFKDTGAKSPLVAEDDEQRQLCGLALGITNLT